MLEIFHDKMVDNREALNQIDILFTSQSQSFPCDLLRWVLPSLNNTIVLNVLEEKQGI